jgi:hypothetical protein
MKELSYNKERVITEMAARATQDLAVAPVRVNVTTGATTGYLISDLFDLDVNNVGGRKVSVAVNDVEEMRELIATARPSAPTSHRRSFTTFLNEMEASLTENAIRRQTLAERQYHYLIEPRGQIPNEGQAGYIVREDYPLRNLGLDDLVGSYNRIVQMQEGNTLWRAGERYGREVVYLSSDLYDVNAGYTNQSFGFSVRFVADLSVTDGNPITTYDMELVVDHSSRVNEGVFAYVRSRGIPIKFSTTGTFEEAVKMANETLGSVLAAADNITTYAIDQRVSELDGLGFNHEMRLITTEAIAS